jgi:hypothetical protein
VLRTTFGPKRDEIIRGWRRLLNEELRNLQAYHIIRMIKSRRMGWTGYVAWIGVMRNAYRVWVGNSKEKRPLGRPRR